MAGSLKLFECKQQPNLEYFAFFFLYLFETGKDTGRGVFVTTQHPNTTCQMLQHCNTKNYPMKPVCLTFTFPG